MLGQVLAIISIFMSDSKPFAASAEVLRARAEDMNGAVMLILAFYFTAPHVGDFARAIIERKSKQQ